jgi:hypothetical protein
MEWIIKLKLPLMSEADSVSLIRDPEYAVSYLFSEKMCIVLRNWHQWRVYNQELLTAIDLYLKTDAPVDDIEILENLTDKTHVFHLEKVMVSVPNALTETHMPKIRGFRTAMGSRATRYNTAMMPANLTEAREALKKALPKKFEKKESFNCTFAPGHGVTPVIVQEAIFDNIKLLDKQSENANGCAVEVIDQLGKISLPNATILFGVKPT